MEKRQCVQCSKTFTIEQRDFAFYKKIDVPPPTWCPQCRLQRRLLFFNERTLYTRACDLCHKQFIGVYPQDSPYTVYCPECWHSDSWDPLSYGRAVDFSKPFFAQLKELYTTVPQIGRTVTTATLENSDFCNSSTYLKNCYLVFNSDYNEECLYSTYLERSKQSLDLYMSDKCELCYSSSNLFQDYQVFFSSNCNDCVNVWFSRSLFSCSDCFGCVNLRNKQYYIFNKPYTKAEYAKKIAQCDTGSYSQVQDILDTVKKLAMSQPRKFAEGLNNVDSSGDYLFNSKNVLESYEFAGGEDSRYCQYITISPVKDSYDFTMWGGGAERMYECMAVGGGGADVRFCLNTGRSHMNMEYSKDMLLGSDYMFGCVGLKKMKYCILNKQYTATEYQLLQKEIIQQMNEMPYVDEKGRVFGYGEFFPPDLSAFGYNETAAQAHFPLRKEQAVAAGFRWADTNNNVHAASIAPAQLPDHISEVPDSIIDETIGCEHAGRYSEHCSGAFRLTKQELAFYRTQRLPLPRACPNCRHDERLHARNGVSTQFWKRQCMCTQTAHDHASRCCTEFQTGYSPDSVEIIYCEPCYQKEIY